MLSNLCCSIWGAEYVSLLLQKIFKKQSTMAHWNVRKLGTIMEMTDQFVRIIGSYFYMALFNN